MPDDDIFPNEEVPEGVPPNGDATPPVVVAPPLSREDVAGYTAQLESMGQTQSDLQNGQAALTQTIQNLMERIGLSGDQNQGEGELDSATFLTDPEAAVRRVAEQVSDQKLREQAGPLLGQLVEQAHAGVMVAEKASIAAQFGPEAWDKEFAPIIDPIIANTRRTAPSQLGNAEAVRNAINSVKGSKFATLVEMGKTATEASASAAQEEQRKQLEYVTSNLTHPIGRTLQSETMTPEMKAHLDAELRETGTRPDEKATLASLNSGPTLSDYVNAQPKKGA